MIGAYSEIKGENNSFYYFKGQDLERAHPLPAPPQVSLEPPAKMQKLEPDSAPVAQPGPRADGRLDGRVKWFSREKGFGKILPTLPPNAEEIFFHRNAMTGGGDGPHFQAVCETYK